MIRRAAVLAAGITLLVVVVGCENDLTRALGAPTLIHEFTDTLGTRTTADIAVSGSNVFAAFYDIDNNDLMFAKSGDGGITWGAPVTVESTGVIGLSPEITINGASIFIIYRDGGGTYHCAESTDGGATWPNKTAIVTPPGNNATNFHFVVSGSNLACFYYFQDPAPPSDYRFAVVNSANRGGVWTVPAVTIATHTATASSPGISRAIHLNSSTVLALWSWRYESILWSSVSLNLGSTWSTPPTRVSSVGDSVYSAEVTSSGSSVYATFWDSNVARLLFASSADSGTTWSPSKKIGASGAEGLWIRTNGSQIVVLHTNQSGSTPPGVETSLDQGVTWASYPMPASSADLSAPLSMAMDGTTTYVLMQNGVGMSGTQHRNQVYMVRSSDWGATWE